MNLRRGCTGMLAVLLVVTGSVVFADEGEVAGNALLPFIPMGQGDTCVEETGFMRRNHMKLLKHQRDETTLRGARNEKYSLAECLSCHAVYGPDAIPVTAASPSHFCRSCHDFTAVNIDCFQCHASRPESGEFPADHQPGSTFPGAANTIGSEQQK